MHKLINLIERVDPLGAAVVVCAGVFIIAAGTGFKVARFFAADDERDD